jgi:hypothetical protein
MKFRAKGSPEESQTARYGTARLQILATQILDRLLRDEASLERIFDWTWASENLTIMRGCGDNQILVQQFKSLRFKEYKDTVIDKDPPSDPMDKDRHLIDCVNYILLDGQRFSDQRGGLSTFVPIYPNLGY